MISIHGFQDSLYDFPSSQIIFNKCEYFHELKISDKNTVHRVWFPWDESIKELPKHYAAIDARIKNVLRNYVFIEWDEKKSENLVECFYPEFYPTYVNYDVKVKKHDSFRYILMDFFGGLFLAHNIDLQKDPFLLEKNKSIVLSIQDRWGRINNGFIISTKGHPFWRYLLDEYLVPNAHKHVLDATGPHILTEAVATYQKKYAIDHSMHVLEKKYLFPFDWNEKLQPQVQRSCFHEDLSLCYDLYPEAYGFAQWHGSWKKYTGDL